MNKERRDALTALAQQIDKATDDWRTTLGNWDSTLSDLRDDEQEAFENLPEGFQQGERGQNMEQVMGYIDEARDRINSAMDALAEIAGEVENAHSVE